jgi:hypothetical protein
MIITLVYKKIAENSDHNIEPRRWLPVLRFNLDIQITDSQIVDKIAWNV